MSDTTGEATIRAAVAAMNAGDVAGYLRSFAPSCERWVAGFEQPLSLAEVEDNLRRLVAAITPLHLEEELLFGNDEFVCARWRLRGTQTGEFLGMVPRGGEVDVSTCEVYKIAAGRVTITWIYQDPGQLFRQMEAAFPVERSQ